MDVSYSAWTRSMEEGDSLHLKGDSFTFLFDRRYTNRLNRMSRVFFDAYCRATKELALEEDRFPSLSEIDSHMESGAVYAFKDRLMKNTEFFEEVKVSGVSYLVPRARRFIDQSGVYTDLVLDLQEGRVALPSRKKAPLASQESEVGKEIFPETGTQPPGLEQAGIETVAPLVESPMEEVPEEGTGIELEAEGKEIPTDVGYRELASEIPSPEHAHGEETGPEEIPVPTIGEVARIPEAGAFEPALRGEASLGPIEASGVFVTGPEEGEKEAEPITGAKGEEKGVLFEGPTVIQEPSLKKDVGPGGPKKVISPPPQKETYLTQKNLALGISVLVILIAGALIMVPGIFFPGETSTVRYSAYISNTTGSPYLSLDIANPSGMENEVHMELPSDLDRSISARGGMVTISRRNGTAIRMSSGGDASVRIFLNRSLDEVPVTLHMSVPHGYDSSLQVHGQSYGVVRVEDTLQLRLNVTPEKVDFEQTYQRI